ncbi:MAG: heme exporter protein CcmB [Alphaproteobacteria bacterium]|nr:heme exporter protein CcmB [Alphaproteobacteria bacterium]
MTGAFLAIVGRDLRLAFRRGGDTGSVVAFFVITVTLFPFGVGPEPNLIARIAPGVLWVAALLAATLSLDRLFRADHEDGSLDLLALSPLPLEVLVLAKTLAHWLATGVPLLVATPLLALLLNLPLQGWGVLLAALALGTPSLSLLGAIGAALTLGVRRGGVLVALLVLPLAVPVLIFGVAAVDAALMGLPATTPLMALGGLLLAALVLAPWAAAAGVRLSLES